jgi:hypothetical protein
VSAVTIAHCVLGHVKIINGRSDESGMRPVLAEEAEGASMIPNAEATYLELTDHLPSAIVSYRNAASAKKRAPPAYNAAWVCN